MADHELPRPFADGADTAPAEPGVPGFELLRELGRGGTAVVYLARQEALDRPVALKMVLAGGFASADDRRRFLAEAGAAAAVQHPGIVQVYEVGACGERPYFALEYCPGGSLAQRLAAAPLSPRGSAELIRQVARAVHAAHAAGVIHRDIKPGNILFTADGAPKVTDFGLAKQLDAADGLTRTGVGLGTPSYMAPEQARGAKAAGPAADVYALGAVLYECLTGRPPFLAATALDTVLHALHDDPVPPSRLAPKLPRDLETVCLKCLQKDPARRYPSAAALADDLGRFLAGQPITARPVPAWERGWKAARRRPAAAVGLAVTSLSVALVVAVVLIANARLQRERDEADAARRAAVAAKEAEEGQRRLASARLRKAVEAVERVMTRAASERWARPEWQDERRRVLEEAVEFFRTFVGEDSRDPTVRREAATAYMHLADAYLALGRYGDCREAADSAYKLRYGLAAESPMDPGPVRGLAESAELLGRLDALAGRYDDAFRRYESAVTFALVAEKIEPASDESKLVLAECYLALGQFLGGRGTPCAADFYARARQLGDELAARPDAPFRHRLVKAAVLVNLAVSDFVNGSPDGPTRLEQARELVEQLDAETPPNARSQEQHGLTRATLHMHRGMALTRAGRRDEGLKAARTGLDGLDALLVGHGNSFSLRAQKLRFLLLYSDLLDLAGRRREAREALAECTRLRGQLLKEFPHLTWLKGIGLLQESHALALRAREGDGEGLDEAARALLAEADPSTAALIRYNWACAHAQLAKAGKPADRDRHAARAVGLLGELFRVGYFNGRPEAIHFAADPDFDPIRCRPEFAKFVEKLKTTPTVVPLPQRTVQ